MARRAAGGGGADGADQLSREQHRFDHDLLRLWRRLVRGVLARGAGAVRARDVGADSRLVGAVARPIRLWRSEEHTSELQSLMRISYAVFCLKKKKNHNNTPETSTDSYDKDY